VRCPYCRANDDKVVDSRLADEGDAIRRRRECLACGRRFTSYERIEEVPLVVHKRSGVTEPFDRAKLVSGIAQAATGRIDPETVAELGVQIEEELRALAPEVDSAAIGLAVLERLRALDPVAYLRFASVYKGFENAADFERELLALDKTTAPKRRESPAADPATDRATDRATDPAAGPDDGPVARPV
jgi:transcriptional repressor NrdR